VGGRTRLPAPGGPTLSPRGGMSTSKEHLRSHTPRDARGRHPVSRDLGDPGRMPRPSGRLQPRGPSARRMAPNCHSPAQPGHSLPRRTRPSCRRMPLTRSHFPPAPNRLLPHTCGRAPSRAEDAGVGRETTEFNDS
jgi:hypothetical protein